MLVGTMTAGFLGEAIGILQILIVQGTGYILGGLIIGWSGIRRRSRPVAQDANALTESL
jgi:hypothetical protein